MHGTSALIFHDHIFPQHNDLGAVDLLVEHLNFFHACYLKARY